MLQMIIRFLTVLNSEAKPGQISMAFCFSMIVGLTPTLSLHNLPVLFLVLIFRVNLSAFILGVLFFMGVSFALDPIFHSIGMKVLTTPVLEPFFTGLYNIPLWRLERFNNSVVMGSVLFSLAAFIPLYFISQTLILRYRETVLVWIRKTRLMQIIQASKIYKLYATYNEWKGGV